MIKTRLEILIDILNVQQNRVVACEIDLTIYNRKNLIVKDQKESAYYRQKIAELTAVKGRAEETIEIITKLIDEEKKKKDKNLPN